MVSADSAVELGNDKPGPAFLQAAGQNNQLRTCALLAARSLWKFCAVLKKRAAFNFGAVIIDVVLTVCGFFW
jgi:hypothetical protein